MFFQVILVLIFLFYILERNLSSTGVKSVNIMKLFELEIIGNMEKLARRHPSMVITNHFVEYDAMVNSIHSSTGPLLGGFIVRAIEQKKLMQHLSWEDVIDCVNSWPRERTDFEIPVTVHVMDRIAKVLFFSFHEWKISWSTIG